MNKKSTHRGRRGGKSPAPAKRIEMKPVPAATPDPLSIPPAHLMEPILAKMNREAGQDLGSDDVVAAQEIIYKAWEAPSDREAVALARKALTVSPDCADAYCILAEQGSRTFEEMLDNYQKGVEAGRRALGEECFKKQAGYFWGLLKTRPYMRAVDGLAACLWAAGQREESVELLLELLHLNPKDNQGVRDTVVPHLLVLNRDKDAEAILNRYKESILASWGYSKALLDFRKYGNSPIAEGSLASAVEANEHVPYYLLRLKPLPKPLPDHFGIGDVNEAVLYVAASKEAWATTPGALAWLATGSV